jgi:hypothetical protein
MHQNRYDLNTCLKLGYVMRSQKISYFIISLTLHQALFSHVTVYGTKLTHGCEEGAYEDTRGYNAR